MAHLSRRQLPLHAFLNFIGPGVVCHCPIASHHLRAMIYIPLAKPHRNISQVYPTSPWNIFITRFSWSLRTDNITFDVECRDITVRRYAPRFSRLSALVGLINSCFSLTDRYRPCRPDTGTQIRPPGFIGPVTKKRRTPPEFGIVEV